MTESLPVEDARSARPYFLSSSPLKTMVRRVMSIVMLVLIDVVGLVIGLYAALALRALVFDPKPILWGLLWTNETDWLPFLILLLIVLGIITYVPELSLWLPHLIYGAPR